MIIRVPVLENFDHTSMPIGFLEIDDERIPKDMKFSFSLGYRELEIGKKKLLCCSVVTDERYHKFLHHVYGKDHARD